MRPTLLFTTIPSTVALSTWDHRGGSPYCTPSSSGTCTLSFENHGTSPASYLVTVYSKACLQIGSSLQKVPGFNLPLNNGLPTYQIDTSPDLPYQVDVLAYDRPTTGDKPWPLFVYGGVQFGGERNDGGCSCGDTGLDSGTIWACKCQFACTPTIQPRKVCDGCFETDPALVDSATTKPTSPPQQAPPPIILTVHASSVKPSIPTTPPKNNILPLPPPVTSPLRSPPTTAPASIIPGIPDCSKYAIVPKGKTCADFAQENHIQLADFLKWNPSLDINCKNLWADYKYCIQGPSIKLMVRESTNHTTGPFGTDVADNCQSTVRVEGTYTCDAFAARNQISVDELTKWNPSLRNGSACVDPKDQSIYCVKGTTYEARHEPYDDCFVNDPASSSPVQSTSSMEPYSPSVAPNPPSESKSPTVSLSNSATPSPGDEDEDIDECDVGDDYIPEDRKSTHASPGLQSTSVSASNLFSQALTSATNVQPSTPASPAGMTPTPHQPNMIPGCSNFQKVRSGDTCSKFATENKISIADFYTWNPDVNTAGTTDCKSLWVDAYYCIQGPSRKLRLRDTVPSTFMTVKRGAVPSTQPERTLEPEGKKYSAHSERQAVAPLKCQD